MRDIDEVFYRGAEWDDLKVGEINAANKAFKLGTLINLTQSQLNFLEDKHEYESLKKVKDSDLLIKEIIKNIDLFMYEKREQDVQSLFNLLGNYIYTQFSGGDDIDSDNTK